MTPAAVRCWLPARNSSFNTQSTMRVQAGRLLSSSGSLKTAAARGSAVAMIMIGSPPSMSTSAAREPTACAWSRGRLRDWVTSRPRPAIHRNRGSRSIAHRPPFSYSRRKSARVPTRVRWRSPGGRAICTWPPSRSRCHGDKISPARSGKRSSMLWKTLDNTSGPFPRPAPQRFHLKVEAIDTVGHRGSAETTDMGPVVVDRSRPRSRIIGLDPTVRSGTGPSARPMR